MFDIEQVKSLFDQALQLPEGETRAHWLRDSCAGDQALFEEVSALLDAYAGAEQDAQPRTARPAPLPAAEFGPYRPIEFLGRGGTSVVYRAERIDRKFSQTVALKVMSAFMGGPEFARRFEQEPRLLASLHHPHIAHLLDGGTSSAGDPYLAMEYVEGERFDRYCDSRKLSIEERLKLILQICDAVEYAHRKMIVHRDLKPNNILVTADGSVKLLDFGTGAMLDARSEATTTRLRMLTARYASPERLRGEGAGVADDVYSLGVILYESLTGRWPFGDPDSVLHELQRAAGNSAPADPASVVSAAAAELRQLDQAALKRKLAGDLTAIVLKALEPDCAIRYSTVRDIFDDVTRYLESRPVSARTPTVYYRTVKFLRRHWLPSAAALVAALALAISSGVAILQARTARAEALKAATVRDFLSGVLSTFGIPESDPEKFTVLQMLAKAEQRLDAARLDPFAEAIVRRSIAESYLGLARYPEARRELDRSLSVLWRAEDKTELAAGLFSHGRLEYGEGNFPAAVADLERCLNLLQLLGSRAPARYTFEAKLSLVDVLSPFALNRDPARRRRLIQEAVQLGEADTSIPRTRVAAAMAEFAVSLNEAGRRREAEDVLARALLTGRREEPGGAWETLPLFLLSRAREAVGDLKGAEEFARQELAVTRNRFGENHTSTAMAVLELARLTALNGSGKSAGAAVDRAMPIIQKYAGDHSTERWLANRNASVAMRLAGRAAEAESFARECVRIAEALQFPASDARLGISWECLGESQAAGQKREEATISLGRAWEIYLNGGPMLVSSVNRTGQRVEQLRNQAQTGTPARQSR